VEFLHFCSKYGKKLVSKITNLKQKRISRLVGVPRGECWQTRTILLHRGPFFHIKDHVSMRWILFPYLRPYFLVYWPLILQLLGYYNFRNWMFFDVKWSFWRGFLHSQGVRTSSRWIILDLNPFQKPHFSFKK